MNSLFSFTASIVHRSSTLVASCLPQMMIQQRSMSKYLSRAARKRVPLNTKRAGKGYYKGKGSTKEGRITSKGRFIVDRKKRLELIVPDLEGFQLKPYVASTASRFAPEIRRRPGQTL